MYVAHRHFRHANSVGEDTAVNILVLPVYVLPAMTVAEGNLLLHDPVISQPVNITVTDTPYVI